MKERSKFEAASKALVDFTLQLVETPSISGEEGDVAELLEAEMHSLGFVVERDELGNVIGIIDAGPGPCVLIDGHMDTVAVTSPESWSYNPWGEVVNGRLYGRGAVDQKGGLAAAVHGIHSLGQELETGKVAVCGTIAEEFVEGPALLRVVERINPNFVVISEATSLRLANGQRGRAEVKIEVVGRPTHSSQPDLGINAAESMADIAFALRDLPLPTHDVLEDAILVLTDLASSPLPALSVVPDYCMAIFDRRTLPGETEKDVLPPIEAAVKRALGDSGAKVRVSINSDDFESYTGARVQASNFAPAWFFDQDSAVVKAGLRGLITADLPAEISQYAFCTNGSETAGRLGIPTLGFGPGTEQLAHRIDEYVKIEDLQKAAKGFAGIAASLLSLDTVGPRFTNK